ncbi:hypothetical protein [Ancylobacter dichloromethanicus]|uniref:Uncharacterized protein n=1 Tax=Ancylobacter dichloromethanicus TaxID=518825 RepID=A0A9W6J7V6_9HYPH|nr:hypothetical protein [Ancylobacter dichloromethanicus]GLK72465.1 hypothetical protein GCM10017643_25810 [Ancylobacter dichloromethanicus]
MAVLLVLASPAAALEDVPVPPGPVAQHSPFKTSPSTLSPSQFSPSRIQPSRALPFVGAPPAETPSGSAGPSAKIPSAGQVEGGDPHTILPQPPAGKVAIGMSARFGAKEGLIPRGLIWRVFADRPEASGAYPLVAEAADPAPVFFLSPGGYVVHVAYGLASVARRIVVGEESRREQLTVPAGAVTLHSDVNDKPLPAEKVTYDLFEGSFLQGRASSRPYYRGALPGDLIILPAGDYYVISTYGDGNAVIQADLAVAAGKVTDATLHHRAGEVTLRLVNVAGGEPLRETQWSIGTPGGDSVKEAITAEPTFVLAEGEYTAVARYEGKTYAKVFNVESGKNGVVEVRVGEQVTPDALDTQDGSGD